MKYRIKSNGCKYKLEWYDEKNMKRILKYNSIFPWMREYSYIPDPQWKVVSSYLPIPHKGLFEDWTLVSYNPYAKCIGEYLFKAEFKDIETARKWLKWLEEEPKRKEEARKKREHEAWCAEQPWEVIEEEGEAEKKESNPAEENSSVDKDVEEKAVREGKSIRVIKKEETQSEQPIDDDHFVKITYETGNKRMIAGKTYHSIDEFVEDMGLCCGRRRDE